MDERSPETIAIATASGEEAAGTACAIVGMSLRMPGGCDSPAAFWRFLQGEAHPVASLSEKRFSWPEFIDPQGTHVGIDRACLIDDVEHQDMTFFGVSAKEAELMDPQQRILLELSWEALESAGIPPSTIGGSTTGVFVGVCHSDYRELVASRALTPEAYVGTGNIPCMLANRLSYFYNFKGPSYTVDTACSSSLFAVAEAVNAIARGDCEQALVGAINLLLTPTSSIAYYQSGMLSSDGTCNPFDDASDGYIRGEGAGMLVVKSLEKARRDRDHVLGIVRAVAINHGGKGRSLTAPSALAQSQVLAKAIERAGVRTDSINYIETHGTGTPVGDPIEIVGIARGLARVAKQQGVALPEAHCALGALKSRIGHAEAAAGMGAMAKVLLAMHHRFLPSNPRLTMVNRRIDLDGGPLFLLREGRPWRSPEDDPETGTLRAGISSFGFGGTNAHLLLESGDGRPVRSHDVGGGPWAFGWSARTDERLSATARRYLDWLSDPSTADVRPRDLSKTLLAGREHMACRIAFVASTLDEVRAMLQGFVEGRDSPGLYRTGVPGAPGIEVDPNTDAGLEARLRRWAGGEEVEVRCDDAEARILPLAPTYPFDRKSYWLPWRQAEAGGTVVAETIHPLLGRNVSDFRRQAYRTVFLPQHPLLAQHRVAGRAVLPAAACAVMGLHAVADACGIPLAQALDGCISLNAFEWRSPLSVDREPETVELRLFPRASRDIGLEFVDRTGHVFCSGVARVAAVEANPAAPGEDVASLPATGALPHGAEACYARYLEKGHEYGPAYRTVVALGRDRSGWVGRLELPADATDDPLPSELIDGALQCVLASELDGVADLRPVMPVAIDAMRVFAPCPRSVHVRVSPSPRAEDTFDIDMRAPDGRLCVRIEGARFVRPTREQLDALFAERRTGDAPMQDAPPAAVTAASPDAVRRVLVGMVAELCRSPENAIEPTRNFSDYGLDSLLSVTLTRQINARWKTRLSPAAVFDSRNLETLVALIATACTVPAAVDTAVSTAESAGVSAAALLPALTVITADMIKADPAAIRPDARFADYGVDSIIIGSLCRKLNVAWALQLKPTTLFELGCLRRLAEHLDGRVSQERLAVAAAAPATPVAAVAETAPRAAMRADAAVRERLEGAFAAPRFPAAGSDPSRGDRSHHAALLHEPQHIADTVVSEVLDATPGDEDVIVAVRAFALNFGDLLCVGGFYPDMPDYPFTPGFEASGVVVSTGPAVRGIAPGDAVVVITGETLGAHATRVQVHSTRVFPMPRGSDFVDACALPVVAMTVLDAFAKARPQPGERILVHSAAGGLGLAAIQIARHHGLEVYATAGSARKLDFLRDFGVHHLVNHREQDFEREIRAMTGGRGIDIVLNTLPGDALQKGLNLLAPDGRYVEMAMTALKSATRVDLSSLGDNQAFFSVNLRKLGLKHPERLREHYERMMALAEQGALRAVVGRTFPFDRYREALEHLAGRESIGKVVVTIPDAMRYDATLPVAPARDAGVAMVRETDIAIVGMSGRFPGSEDLDALWSHLAQGDELVGPVTRWNLAAYHPEGRSFCGRGAFLDRIDAFDPLFFGIAGIEARYMDPQQRLLLEEAWHALEDAGYASALVNRGACGVYIGATEGDYPLLFGAEDVPPQAFWGNALSLIPGRIAYHLDLRGPAVAIDTACSSSLVAIHQACQALWLGEIDMALAGGVFVHCTPKLYLSSERADMLSHRGRCHTFGADADGFVPGEGVGVVVLKRLQRALADGDHVHAVIRGSGIGQDGTTNGITAPSGQAQERLECAVYRRFGIDPADIGMVEAHGTGTSLGDPIEFDALSRSFSAFTDRRRFCSLGSIKSNLGHLAPAAGIAGLLKIVLSMRHDRIPPTLHCRPPNPYIDIDDSPFYLSERLHAWPDAPGGERLAALSSFGFSGTNAHLVIASHAASAAPSPSPSRPAHLIAFSAQSDTQLTELAERLLGRLRAASVDCGHLGHTLLTGRRQFTHRLACVVADSDDLAVRLEAWLSGRDRDAVAVAQVAVRGDGGSRVLRAAGEACLARASSPVEAERRVDDLRTLAELFLQGYDFDYGPLYAGGGFRRIPLPTYPFARHRYWVPERTPGTGHALHPLVHENRSSLARQRYGSVFTGVEPCFADHRVHGRPVLSAAAQLEMARFAAASALDVAQTAVRLEDVVWSSPLIAEGGIDVGIELAVDGDESVRFEIVADAGSGATAHCRGRARRTATETRAPQSIEPLPVGSESRRFVAGDCYEAYRRRGIEYGPSHAGLVDVAVGPDGDLAEATVILPDPAPFSGMLCAPGILDAALQATIGFSLADDAIEDRPPLVPYALTSFVVHRAPGAMVRVALRRRRNAGGIEFDVELRDPDGTPCVSLSGLQVRPLVALPATRTADDGGRAGGTLALCPTWRPQSAPTQIESKIGAVLAIGLDATTLDDWRADLPGLIDAGIDIDAPLDSLHATLAAHDRFDRLLVVMPGATPDVALDDALLERHDRQVRFLHRLFQALVAHEHHALDLDWTIVTIRGQAVDATDPVDPASASIHGIVGSMAKEYPHWSLRLLDLDTLTGLRPQVLFSTTADPMGNAWLVRAGGWYRQSLVPCRVPKAQHRPYREGGVYVVLGGAGGIGEVYTEHLIRRYRARVVWLGRRPPDAALEAKLDRLGALGTRPLYLQVDATDREALTEARRRVFEAFGAIHGVIHSSIVLADASLAQMGEDALFRALDAKTRTGVRLAQVFGADPLDFMLFFSSANSYLRAPGQANYVAGCLFEDAFAQALALRVSYPVKVMNWGYWGTVGVVANAAVRQRIAAFGLDSIDPAAAMAVIDDLLAGPFEQFAYLAVHRAIESLGVPIAAGIHWEVAPESACADPVGAVPMLERALAGAADLILDESRGRIEAAALTLLWRQIVASGLVVRIPDGDVDRARFRSRGDPGRHARWFGESLRRLADAGTITIMGDEFVEAARLEDEASIGARWSALVADVSMSDSRYWLSAVDAMLRALPDILAGRRLATEVLFPEASMTLVEGIYKSDPVARVFNEALATIVATHARQFCADGMRMIEIGAGTGSASECILGRLGADGVRLAEYVYTDVSRAFLFHAENHYGPDADFMRYDLLDIERPLPAESAHAGRYDVVVAANVLHATADIVDTLRHARALLRRGGLLLINEIAENSLMMHLTFGLLDGWWLHRDEGLRLPGGPALSPEGWRRALCSVGFASSAWPMAQRHGLGYQIVIAQSDGIVEKLDAQDGVSSSPSPIDAPEPPVEHVTTGAAASFDGVVGDRATMIPSLVALLRGMAAAVLGLREDELDSSSKPFAQSVLGAFGLDSLLSATLRNRVLKEIGVDIPVQVLIGEPVADIVDQMYQQLLLRQVSVAPQERGTDGDYETLVF